MMIENHQMSRVGDDGWSVIADYLDQHGVKSVLLVTGQSGFKGSGAEAMLAPILEPLRVRRINDFSANPKAEDIRRVLSELPSSDHYDIILAVGGGSVMDVSKLLKAFWHTQNPVDAHLEGEEDLSPADIPLITVPTTAGSGSEATHFAVVYEGKTKYSIAHEELLPNLAVVIPSLLKSLPRHIAAASGLDALCQGIESYWSIYSDDRSKSLAKEAIQLAWQSLDEFVNERTTSSMADMARASNLAGQAINLTKTTAPHAVSYALTSYYGIAHGQAVALLMPAFLRYNAAVTADDCLDPRGVSWVKHVLGSIGDMLGCRDACQAASMINQRVEAIGLQNDLSKLGVDSDQDVDVIVKNGFNPQRVNNNPRRLTESGLRNMLRESCNIPVS